MSKWTDERIDGLIKGVSQEISRALAAKLSDDEMDFRSAIRVALNTWRRQTLVADRRELPFEIRDKLLAWGVPIAAPAGGATPVGPANQTELSSATPMVASPAHSPEPGTPALDLDDALQTLYDDALAQERDGNLSAAMEGLAAVVNRAQGRLKLPAALHLANAQQKRETQTRELVEQAQVYANKHPDDLQGQRRQWQTVLDLNPSDTEADRAIKRLTPQQIELDLRQRLDRWRSEAKTAANQNNVGVLNERLGQVQAVASQPISPALASMTAKLVEDITDWRELVRTFLGLGSTMLIVGETRPAYEWALEKVRAGISLVIDTPGFFGAANAIVTTTVFYEHVRQRFVASTRDVVGQRRDLARSQALTDPELALKTLKSAEDLLTDPVWEKTDLVYLTNDRKLLADDYAEIEKEVAGYRTAYDLVQQAGRPGQTWAKQLELYREARGLFKNYDGIGTYIDAAREIVADEQAGLLDEQFTLVRQRVARDEYDQALNLLAEARRAALTIEPQPAPGSRLELALKQLAERENEVIAAQSTYDQLQGLLREVDEALKQYDQGHKAALAEAQRVFQDVPESARQRNDVKRRQAALLAHVDDSQLWIEGQRQYRQAQWEAALPALTKVAAGSRPEKTEASQLAGRAEAALRAEEAAIAAKARDWRTAREKAQAALLLFDQWQADAWTKASLDRCKGQLEALQPLAQNDELVQHAITTAAAQRQAAELRAQARTGVVASQVEPIVEFEWALAELGKVQKLETSLAKEYETELILVRESWRRKYMDSLTAAQVVRDVEVLAKAVGLANTLNQNGLLYQQADKDLARSVEEAYLEARLAVLQRQLTDLRGDDQLPLLLQIEESRRRRLDLAPVPTADLRAALHAATRQRVLAALGRARLTSPAAARDYLANEPALFGDDELLRELMQLCWELRDWSEADRRARSLAFHPPPQRYQSLSQVWLGLSAAARQLDTGAHGQAASTLTELRQRFDGNPEWSALIVSCDQWLKTWRVESLLTQADHAMQQGQEAATLTAALWYAGAFELAAADPRIANGLLSAGARLKPLLPGQVARARGLRLEGRSLPEALEAAQELHRRLANLHAVSAKLGLDDRERRELDNGLKAAAAKIAVWDQTHRALTEAALQRQEAKLHPLPLRLSEGTGGWSLEPTRLLLQQVPEAARADPECGVVLADELAKVDEDEALAGELNRLVLACLRAMQVEDFEASSDQAVRLERRWRGVQSLGFGGLEVVLRYRPPVLNRELLAPAAIRQTADKQKENAAAWTKWATDVGRAYRPAREVARKLPAPLVRLQQDRSLHEVEAETKIALGLIEAFEAAWNGRPDEDPMSQKALKAKESSPPGWEDELLREQARIAQLLAEAQRTRQRFEKEKLSRLLAVMSQVEQAAALAARGPTVWDRVRGHDDPQTVLRLRIESARLWITRCETVQDDVLNDVADAYHPAVIRARERLDALANPSPGDTTRGGP